MTREAIAATAVPASIQITDPDVWSNVIDIDVDPLALRAYETAIVGTAASAVTPSVRAAVLGTRIARAMATTIVAVTMGIVFGTPGIDRPCFSCSSGSQVSPIIL